MASQVIRIVSIYVKSPINILKYGKGMQFHPIEIVQINKKEYVRFDVPEQIAEILSKDAVFSGKIIYKPNKRSKVNNGS